LAGSEAADPERAGRIWFVVDEQAQRGFLNVRPGDAGRHHAEIEANERVGIRGRNDNVRSGAIIRAATRQRISVVGRRRMLRSRDSRKREQQRDRCKPNKPLQRRIHGKPLQGSFLRGARARIDGGVIGARRISSCSVAFANHLRLASQFETSDWVAFRHRIQIRLDVIEAANALALIASRT
jgi:hypothetical protein